MPDRVVYLVTRVTKAMQGGELEFVDDADLARLLAQGYETSTTLPDRKVRVDGRSVTATMMVLKQAAENRGLATREAGGRQVRITDDFGNDQTVDAAGALSHAVQSLSRGLSLLGGASHLGGAGDRKLPGMTIISGERIGQAFDLGVNAAMAGMDESTCPFPNGSEPFQLWMAGYRRGRSQAGAPDTSVPEYDAERAFAQGRDTARSFGPNDVVTCPYSATNPLRRYWVAGFREGGGRVEG